MFGISILELDIVVFAEINSYSTPKESKELNLLDFNLGKS